MKFSCWAYPSSNTPSIFVSNSTSNYCDVVVILSNVSSVISAQTDSQGEVVDVVKEVLTIQLTDEVEDEYAKNEFALPGSKYAHFKVAMLKKLVSKKEADWNKYQTEKRRYTSDNFDDEEIGNCRIILSV